MYDSDIVQCVGLAKLVLVNFALTLTLLFIPFSERKGYRRLKYVKKAIISFCLSKPIRNELFHFSSFQCSDKTLL
jgi:hypothetical protein